MLHILINEFIFYDIHNIINMRTFFRWPVMDNELIKWPNERPL